MKRFEYPKSGKNRIKAKKMVEDPMLKEEQAKLDAEWAIVGAQLGYEKSAEKTKSAITPISQHKIGAEWKNSQVLSLGRDMPNTKDPLCTLLSAQKYPLSEVCRNTQNDTIVGTSNLKKEKGSSLKKVKFSEIVDTKSPNKRKSGRFVRKQLFEDNEGNLHIPGEQKNIPAGTGADDSNASNESIKALGLDNSAETINSSMEFNQYETMCSSPAATVKRSKEEINNELKSFIEKQNAEMLEKISNIMNENTKIILGKINEMVGEPNAVTNNETVIDSNVAQKRKAQDLRVNVMKKTLNAKCPDTPVTHKRMKKSIDIYKTINQGLDSPRPHRSLLETPDGKVPAKSALSRILQKQCYALIDG